MDSSATLLGRGPETNTTASVPWELIRHAGPQASPRSPEAGAAF